MRAAGRMIRFLLGFVFLMACCNLRASAQIASGANHATPAGPDYDVATVKVNNTGSSSSDIDISNGILRVTNVQLRALLEIAFDIRREQIVGLPHWAQVDRYDMAAKVVDIDPRQFPRLADDQQRVMLQHLLEQRFQLQTHVETRTLPLLELSVAKGGIRFAEWQKSSDDPDGKRGSMSVHNEEMTATGVQMDSLARFLSSATHMPVVDKTGLKGTYDLHMKWQREEEGQASGLHDQALPTIYAALREQLGLKLQSGKGPVKVLVVDHVQQPSEN